MRTLPYLLMLTLLAVNCIPNPDPEVSSFDLEIQPPIVQQIIPGQHCVLLVRIVDETSGTGQGAAVALTAAVFGASVSVEPQSLLPGEVAEVTVIAEEASMGEELTVAVSGTREGLEATDEKTLSVAEGNLQEYEDSLLQTAEEVRDLFIPWIEANHPDFGITSQTQWSGQVVTPIWLVVSHYLFFSDEWEMHVYWHVMIPPYDWARIDLRRRSTEITYSYSFEISSRSDAQAEPQAIELPEQVWR